MIAIFDGIGGNVSSVKRMFESVCDYDVTIVNSSEEIINARLIVLPGVGHFDTVMKRLRAHPAFSTIENKVLVEKTLFLGICAGMQILFEHSEEGSEKGLGWIEGCVKRLPEVVGSSSYKVPHIGWNNIQRNQQSVFKDIKDKDERFYFVHSYAACCKNEEEACAKTKYGIVFDSVVSKGNIFGMQFHPEKSHIYGAQILKNLTNLLQK